MKKRINPKPRTVRVSVRLSPDALTWLETEADRFGMMTSELLRRIVDDARGARIGQRTKATEPVKEAVR
jgi:hypothetical protein